MFSELWKVVWCLPGLFFKFICCTHNARKNMANRNRTLHGTSDFNQTWWILFYYTILWREINMKKVQKLIIRIHKSYKLELTEFLMAKNFIKLYIYNTSSIRFNSHSDFAYRVVEPRERFFLRRRRTSIHHDRTIGWSRISSFFSMSCVYVRIMCMRNNDVTEERAWLWDDER